MKSFPGMCGVYRRFVADFAKIAKPLTALTSTELPKRLPPPSVYSTAASFDANASNDAHFWSVCFRTSRPLTLFLTTGTDSAMPCYSWGSSQPICYGYKRGVLQMPQQGGSNRRSLALSEGASFDARPGII